LFEKKTYYLSLFVFISAIGFFLSYKLISILTGILFLSFFFIFLLFIYLRKYKLLKQHQIETQEYREKINSLVSEISDKKAYLDYLPQTTQRLNFFKRLTEEFIKTHDLSDIYQCLSEEIKNAFSDFDIFLLYTTTRYQKLKLTSSYKISPDFLIKAKNGDVLDHWVMRHNQGLLVEDISQDFRFALEPNSAINKRGISSLLISPMLSGEKIIGLIRIESKSAYKFNFEDLRILSVIADLASVAIDRATIFKKVRELAIKDGMTDLYRKDYFIQRLKEEMNRAMINQTSIGIMLLDIDHFKNLNDKYGHIVGDSILKKLSLTLKKVIGNSGNLICRFGGEEFIIFLVKSSKEQTLQLAETLRQEIENLSLAFRRTKVKFTISIGTAVFPSDAFLLKSLIEKADQALYKAKSQGRNKVCSA
jgi:diguanylate cyclase (GGDEF)-like protein